MIYDKDNIEVYHTPAEADALRQALIDLPEGNLIEVGVYMGGSAKIIADTYPDRTLYACDTYTGFPDNLSPENGDGSHYFVGQMGNADFDTVQKNLSGHANIVMVKGQFPESFSKKDKFAFAHIDVDTYNSMKDSLEFIYPKMVSGGRLLIHDYPAHRGVKKAVDEFMVGKEDKMTILETGGRQLLIQHGTA